jgi:hypothetical protein
MARRRLTWPLHTPNHAGSEYNPTLRLPIATLILWDAATSALPLRYQELAPIHV